MLSKYNEPQKEQRKWTALPSLQSSHKLRDSTPSKNSGEDISVLERKDKSLRSPLSRRFYYSTLYGKGMTIY